MPGRKTVADRAFEKKLKGAVDEKNWDKVVQIFNQYGNYLELLDEPLPAALTAQIEENREHPERAKPRPSRKSGNARVPADD